MNKAQRTALEAHMLRMQEITGELETIKEAIESLRDEAQETFDNKSERWQECDKGQEAQEQIGRLTTAYDDVDSAASSTSEAADALEEWTSNA